jgi:hypothetical protein
MQLQLREPLIYFCKEIIWFKVIWSYVSEEQRHRTKEEWMAFRCFVWRIDLALLWCRICDSSSDEVTAVGWEGFTVLVSFVVFRFLLFRCIAVSFISVFTRYRHWSPSRVRLIQFISTFCFSKIHFISHLHVGTHFGFLWLSHRNYLLFHSRHIPCPSHRHWFDYSDDNWRVVFSIGLLLNSFWVHIFWAPCSRDSVVGWGTMLQARRSRLM